MKQLLKISMLLFIISIGYQSLNAQSKTMDVESFNKIILSPNIDLRLVEGNSESVKIQSSKISSDKITVEVKGKTLRIYLEDAKFSTKNRKEYRDNSKMSVPIYQGAVATILVTYKDLKKLSIRGEEEVVCESRLSAKKFVIKMYGEAELTMKEVNIGLLKTALFGENVLEIKRGVVQEQIYRTYGENEVKVQGLENETARFKSFGDNEFDVNTSEEIKLFAMGDSKVSYTGDAHFRKGLVLGDSKIRKMK